MSTSSAASRMAAGASRSTIPTGSERALRDDGLRARLLAVDGVGARPVRPVALPARPREPPNRRCGHHRARATGDVVQLPVLGLADTAARRLLSGSELEDVAADQGDRKLLREHPGGPPRAPGTPVSRRR